MRITGKMRRGALLASSGKDAPLRPMLFVGLVAILAQILLGAAVVIHAPSPAFIAGVFLLAVPLGLFVARHHRGAAFPTIGLLALAGVAPGLTVDAPLFGRVVNLRSVDSIPADAFVAGYVAPGWRVETRYVLEERPSYGRGNRPTRTRRIAPLVGDGWTPAHPVEVWVVGDIFDSGRELPSNPGHWSDPGEYTRLVGTDVTRVQLAARRAADAHGLKTADEPLVVKRAGTVANAVREERLIPTAT